MRRDVRVQRELGRFWQVYEKRADGCVGKEEYLRVHAKLALVLIPDLAVEEALASGEDDWLQDAKGKEAMSEADVKGSLFELADMWCHGIDGEEYATFLRKLFKRITVKYVTKADGAVFATSCSCSARFSTRGKYLQSSWYVRHHVDLDAPVHGSFFLGDVVAEPPRPREAHGVDAVHVDAALRDEGLYRFRPGLA